MRELAVSRSSYLFLDSYQRSKTNDVALICQWRNGACFLLQLLPMLLALRSVARLSNGRLVPRVSRSFRPPDPPCLSRFSLFVRRSEIRELTEWPRDSLDSKKERGQSVHAIRTMSISRLFEARGFYPQVLRMEFKLLADHLRFAASRPRAPSLPFTNF